MKTDSTIINRYRNAQQRVRDVIENLSDHDYRSQFHPELSALGWHLAHCLYIENYWLREVLCADDTLTKGLDLTYLPEKSYKPDRGGKLPELKQLLEQAVEFQNNNIEYLKQLTPIAASQYLLIDDYLPLFIIQHYDQHYESMQMALQQRAINKDYSNYQVTAVLESNQTTINTTRIEKDAYIIGSNDTICYDNEQPQHKVTLDDFSIAINPVSNGQFLAFMQDNGYRNKELWSDDGWHWLQDNNITAPEHWRIDKHNNWFGIANNGAFDLGSDDTLYGINYFEAMAFAKWSGARLAHEHEWEVAQQLNLLNNSGQAWEWCHNAFYPYPNFKAFPYEGYSSPWFEQPHFVLKGGSLHTQNNIKRSSFRNFFGPDKRHVFAGCRLVYAAKGLN